MDQGSMDPHVGPGPWTTLMDQVHGPPVMDRVHDRNRAKRRLKTTTITSNTRSISIIQCTTFTSCQNAACFYELFPLTGGLCFGGKRFD